ncbi:uncharacterized protein LOC122381237 [Amphibalanus amphitrite]|uniref:uncharacterized protein LOC122381237 n=1 Tax=Amphibalanus amphitrite TaxID=1232801 RepID=UPI001C8FF938|nr:uncharacterized protein LOC122381237 [Amphibalanus amphitrite]XP_043221125.1 uncharacterized protein LOC122381237 [Amphibalanus amphitrite]XP_043221126.1 uncharacterized protein LOC122381237 [Amphibalanus amphitrite]XP_043221127.1 uncharacterized protein LOC122381237 [Amphibalanus amphitrite]
MAVRLPPLVTLLLLLVLESGVRAARLDLFDRKQGIRMGVPSNGCDDGKTGLSVDYNGSAVEYTCFLPKSKRWRVGLNVVEPVQHCDDLPDDYYPQHYCMNQSLVYKDTIPTYGDHRPLWGIFGEYQYLPPQRWLHNVEHGSVIMLYHPCADYREVDRLKGLVRGCIRKHIITPYPKLSLLRPLALVAWGCRLEMSHVDPATVRSFIREKGLKGPEGDLPKQGQYDFMLLQRAEPPAGSDINDSVLCPNQP